MKDLRHIKSLLEKYYNGETSTEEEKELMNFFHKGEVPDELHSEAELFGFINRERNESVQEGLEERIMQAIDAEKPRNVNPFSKYRSYWISGVAAAVLIILAIFIDTRLGRNGSLIVKEDTFEDPYLAYVEAKRVLYYVSEKMNTGREPLQNLEKLNTGVGYVQPVFSFGPGIQALEYLNTIEKTKELISK